MNKSYASLALGALLILATVPLSHADDSVVVPNGNTTISGNAEIGEVLNGYNSETGQTVQYVISAADLLSLQDTTLTGIAFRLNNMYAPSLPAISYANFSIQLSAVAGGEISSPVFNNNILDGTVVYNDAFTFAANAFPTGAEPSSEIPNDFGPYIKFATPYNYTTGDLLVTIRHTQPTGAEQSDYWSVDGNMTETSPALIAHDANAEMADLPWSVVPVTEFTTSTSLPDNAEAPTVIPEPGAYALLLSSFGLLACLRKLGHAINIHH